MKKYLFFAILFASCVFTLNAQTKSDSQTNFQNNKD
jgi:hypothetical protein